MLPFYCPEMNIEELAPIGISLLVKAATADRQVHVNIFFPLQQDLADALRLHLIRDIFMMHRRILVCKN